MNLDYLRTYLQVVRLGSFSEAARRLTVSQPAVSFQISKLERDLGVRLIDRRAKDYHCDRSGETPPRFCRIGRARAGQPASGHRPDPGRGHRHFVIAASTIPGEILLLPVLSEFQVRHPAVSVRVEISDSLEVISRVQEGDYDVGFCGIAPQRKELDYFKFAQDEIVLIVFPEHPFTRRKEVSLSRSCRANRSSPGRRLQALKAASDPCWPAPELPLVSGHPF